MNDLCKRAGLSLAFMALMVLTSFSAIAAVPAAAGTDQATATDTVPLTADNGSVTKKLDPALEKSMTESRGPFKVYVVVNDRDIVNQLLGSKGLSQIMGKEFPGIPTVRLMELDAKTISALAESPGVSNILAYEQPTVDERNVLDRAAERSQAEAMLPGTEDYDVDVVQGAAAAWAEGFKGEGVKIADIDTGFDMAHPDMQGQAARYDNPASPYYGWPIGYDDYGAYVWANGMIGGWMADTSTVVTATDGAVTFDGTRYVVAGIKDATGAPLMSMSGMYKIGYHPDATLAGLMGGQIAVLVVDSKTAGIYDTVYVDVTHDLSFANDKPCTKGDEISYFDAYNARTGVTSFASWNGGDGYADFSGGMAYWISDGTNVYPASDWSYGATFVPRSGDAVAFMGEYLGDSHGTMTSSGALAMGRTMGGLLGGMAPDAKLIMIPFTGSTVNAWLFAEYGADGMLGTGDEANIVSNSYGWSESSVYGGFGALDMINTYISLSGPTLWLWSTGNGGPGYGTVHEVTNVASVHVGAGTTMMYRYLLGYERAPGYQKWGDVIPFSNSGPTRAGKLNAEIIASGAYSFEPMPLNEPDELGSIGNGAQHFQLGSGTSHATPTVAGGAALGYQAYFESMGMWPAKDLAKAVLMGAADDMHFDPLKQGAGWLNAKTYADLMAGTGGTVTFGRGSAFIESALYPGSLNGKDYETFPNFILPGRSDTSTLYTYNMNQTATTHVKVSSELLLRTLTKSYPLRTKNVGDVFIDITKDVPATTDLLKVTMYMPFSQFDPEMDYVSNVQYWLELHDWVDLNHNGVMSTNSKSWELFRYTVDGSDSNYNQAMIKDPIPRTHDGLIVRVRAIDGMKGVNINVQIDCYELKTFPWIKLRAGRHSGWTSTFEADIAPGSSLSWFVKTSVPMGTPVGTYAAAIYVDDGSRIQCIPVVINVPAQSYEFKFGGPSVFETPYNNNITGVADKAWRFEVGDWRIYWSVPTTMPVENQYLMVGAEWLELPTDINLHVLAPVATDAAGNAVEAVFDRPYGPGYYEVPAASSDEMYMGAGTFGVKTNTGGPKEVIAAPLGMYENALNTPAPFAVVLRCPVMAGRTASESFSGFTKQVVMNGYSPQRASVTIDLSNGDALSGTIPAWYDITVDGTIQANGGGIPPMVGDSWPNEPIYQDQLTGSYEEQLANAKYTRIITVASVDKLTVAVNEVANCPDIDLALWYDANMDGVAQLSEPYWYVGTASSSESLTLTNPADGQYLVKVLGYSVTGAPGYFSLSVLRGVQGAEVTAVNMEPLVGSGMHAFDIYYSFPAVPGTYVSYATFGFMGANDMFSIEVTVNIVA